MLLGCLDRHEQAVGEARRVLGAKTGVDSGRLE